MDLPIGLEITSFTETNLYILPITEIFYLQPI